MLNNFLFIFALLFLPEIALPDALHAASQLEDGALRKVFLCCSIERNALLLEIENAYLGIVEIRDDIPVAKETGHGYGCRSMCAIAEKRNGFCIFKAVDGVFTLRMVLPAEQ